jgi:hypothetical protein
VDVSTAGPFSVDLFAHRQSDAGGWIEYGSRVCDAMCGVCRGWVQPRSTKWYVMGREWT